MLKIFALICTLFGPEAGQCVITSKAQEFALKANCEEVRTIEHELVELRYQKLYPFPVIVRSICATGQPVPTDFLQPGSEVTPSPVEDLGPEA